jgi:hypothetical protein
LKADLSEKNQIEAEESTSQLSAEQQVNLLKLVRDHGSDWDAVQAGLGLADRKSAILEFLRLDLSNEHFKQLGSILGE